jgi:hypothetical protein
MTACFMGRYTAVVISIIRKLFRILRYQPQIHEIYMSESHQRSVTFPFTKFSTSTAVLVCKEHRAYASTGSRGKA